MGIYEQKHDLYRRYCQELNTYCVDKITEQEAWETCEMYISSAECSWHNIYDADGKELVGFFIAGKAGAEKHPDSVRSVAQAYILPAYRNRGLMTQCVTDYMGRHPGIYSLLVLRDNVAAIGFWKHMFKNAGYVPCKLDASYVKDPETELMAFGPKTK